MQLLGWVGMGDTQCLATNSETEWCHLVRATFHNETPSKDHEAKLLASCGALYQHIELSMFSIRFTQHPTAPVHSCIVLLPMGGRWRIVIHWDDIHCDRHLSVANDTGCSCTKRGGTSRCK